MTEEHSHHWVPRSGGMVSGKPVTELRCAICDTKYEPEIHDDSRPETWGERLRRITKGVAYKEGFTLVLARDNNGWYLQIRCKRPDIVTKQPGVGKSPKAYVDPTMSDSQIVRRIFAMFLAYEEHECREWFTYGGKRIFGPHISIEALSEVSERLEP